VFEGVRGEPSEFEYWSLAKSNSGVLGYVQTATSEKPDKGIMKQDFVARTREFLGDALDRWILGTDPFIARLNPDLPGYADYDQLMRLDEWLPLMTREDWDAA